MPEDLQLKCCGTNCIDYNIPTVIIVVFCSIILYYFQHQHPYMPTYALGCHSDYAFLAFLLPEIRC